MPEIGGRYLPENPPWVAVDTETSGLHPDDGARVACVSVTWPYSSNAGEDEGFITASFPFDQGVRDKIGGAQLGLFEPAEDPNLQQEAWDELLAWLSTQDLVFHNAKYDLTMLAAGTRHWPGLDLSAATIWDTMLAAGEIDPTEQRGLDAVTKRLDIGKGKEGLDKVKDWLKSNKHPTNRYDLVPWDIVKEYVETDTELTAELYDWQLEHLAQLGQEGEPLHDRILREVDLMVTLYRMERRGIGYDAEQSAKAAALISKRGEEIKAGLPFNPDVKSAVAHYFTEVLGLEPDRRTEKKKEPQIDEEQLRKWIKNGVPNAQELDDYNRCKRAVSMWYLGYVEKMGADGRLRCSFRQGHVKSGRMSVERVQLQAMPKKDKFADASGQVKGIFEGVPGVRDLMIASPGKAIWQLDLSQAELRVASRYAGCKRMLEQLANGEDIHSNTCVEVLGVSRDDPSWKEKRDIAKRLTFGGIFQIGGEKFQATLAKLADMHLPLAECEKLVRGWRGMYPEFGQMYYKSMKMADRQKCVPLLRGTEYEVLSYFGPRDWPNSAWNRVVQGSLAEAFKILLTGVEERWPGRLVLTVHDSVYLECDVDEGDRIAAECAEWAADLMTDLFKIEMKMDIDRPKELANA